MFQLSNCFIIFLCTSCLLSAKPPVHVTHSARLSSTKSPSVIDSRACNLVLFGLSDNDSILKLKSEIDEVLEFLAGKQVTVNDVFRLCKFSASSNCPRPVLIKLATACRGGSRGWQRVLKHPPQLKDAFLHGRIHTQFDGSVK